MYVLGLGGKASTFGCQCRFARHHAGARMARVADSITQPHRLNSLHVTRVGGN
jgi:hypothetical protein